SWGGWYWDRRRRQPANTGSAKAKRWRALLEDHQRQCEERYAAVRPFARDAALANCFFSAHPQAGKGSFTVRWESAQQPQGTVIHIVKAPQARAFTLGGGPLSSVLIHPKKSKAIRSPKT